MKKDIITLTDDELTEVFREAVRETIEDSRKAGNPICGYDSALKKTYIEYTDGRKEYTNTNKPMILVFAGPNGSGKSTVTKAAAIVGEYINADDIKKELQCGDMEAAQIATAKREELLLKGESFTFETVLSSRRNLELLQRASRAGYYIKCCYMLTASPEINVQRVFVRVKNGGHDVPVDKIHSRYHKCLKLVPELIDVCDDISIFDNTRQPYMIFSKKKDESNIYEFDIWERKQIEKLIGTDEDETNPIFKRFVINDDATCEALLAAFEEAEKRPIVKKSGPSSYERGKELLAMRYGSDNPFKPVSKEEIYAKLEESRACFERGEYKEFDEAIDEIRQKYDL